MYTYHKNKLSLALVYCFVQLLVSVKCAPVTTPQPSPAVDDDASAMDVLKRYQYMGEGNPDSEFAALVDKEAYVMALKNFQIFNNLTVTGELDEETMAKMNSPRCGVVDIIYKEDNAITVQSSESAQNNRTSRRRRYAHQGGSWPKTDLTYYISDFSKKLSRDVINEQIRRAFSVWEMVTPLKFTQVYSDRADIVILFAEGYHNDDDPFDGRGRTLAHAYFPAYGGDAHFDDAERWTINSRYGTNIFQVAAHEFGHSLGLGHSTVSDALMAPYYPGYQSNFELHNDDVQGIQSLYGRKPVTEERTTRSPTTQPPGRSDPAPQPPSSTSPPVSTPDINTVCNAGKFDAITAIVINGETKHFAFYNNLYMLLDDRGIVAGYPKRISEGWPGLPDNLDAAITFEAVYRTFYSWNYATRSWEVRTEEISPARTYFFKGSQYWRADNGQMVTSSYPRSISRYWGLPDNIDAAFIWSGNGKAYFVKDNQYYRYSNNRLDRGYPKPFSLWTRKINTIDSAVQWQDETFFFLGNQYYKFDDNKIEIVDGYPRSTSRYWLGCDRFTNSLQANDNQHPKTQQENGDVVGNLASNTKSNPLCSLLTASFLAMCFVLNQGMFTLF